MKTDFLLSICCNKRFLFSFLFLCSLFGCADNPGDSDHGEQFVQSRTDVSLVDTFSVDLSTVLLNNVVTSGTETILIGHYRDTVFGQITSNSYFQIGIPETYDVQQEDLYDSLHLTLKYNHYYYGDTTRSQRILVHRLREKIEFDDDGVITSTSSVNYDPIPLGSMSYVPLPNGVVDSVTIRIDDAVGRDFFQKLVDRAEIMSDNQILRDYFPGLLLKPDESAVGSIIGFTTKPEDVKLVLFLRKQKTFEEYEVWFGLGDSARQFNNIIHNFTSTQLEPLVDQRNELASHLTDGRSFLQGGIALAIRVDFPTLQEALLFERSSILAAQLSIFVEKNSYGYFGLPSRLYIYESNVLNELGNITAESKLVVDEVYNEETTYTFDVTKYLTDELADSYVDPEKGLLITLPVDDNNTKFHRLIIDSVKKKPKINILYLSY